MKCLEKDRVRRYETANGLTADIRRHLDNEPVLARPPSVGYRFQKLVCRNKVAFAAATAIAVVLVLAVAVSSWQAVKAKRAEREARQQAKLAKEQAAIARSVRDFLTEQLLGTSNPFIDPVPDANKRPLLERIARQLEGKFVDQPVIEAELRFALGDALEDIDETAKAMAQFAKCLEIRRRVLTLQHSDTLEAAAGLARVWITLGRRVEAQKLLAEAMAVARTPPLGESRGAGWVLFNEGYLVFRTDSSTDLLPLDSGPTGRLGFKNKRVRRGSTRAKDGRKVMKDSSIQNRRARAGNLRAALLVTALLALAGTALVVADPAAKKLKTSKIAPPHSTAHGKSLAEWLGIFWRWNLSGADPAQSRVGRVQLLPIPAGELISGTGTPDDPVLLRDRIELTLPAGTPFVMSLFAWIEERYDGYPGVPDDLAIDNAALLAGVSPELTIDGRTVITAANEAAFYIPPTPFDPIVVYPAPSSYGSIAALFFQGVGFVSEPLTPGVHEIHLYEPYIIAAGVYAPIPAGFGTIYDYTWIITVKP